MRVEFAKSARKHRIGRTRAVHVINNPIAQFTLPGGEGYAKDPRLVFLGDDATGRALEVMAVTVRPDVLLVIHVQDLRPKYRPLYEEGKS